MCSPFIQCGTCVKLLIQRSFCSSPDEIKQTFWLIFFIFIVYDIKQQSYTSENTHGWKWKDKAYLGVSNQYYIKFCVYMCLGVYVCVWVCVYVSVSPSVYVCVSALSLVGVVSPLSIQSGWFLVPLCGLIGHCSCLPPQNNNKMTGWQ